MIGRIPALDGGALRNTRGPLHSISLPKAGAAAILLAVLILYLPSLDNHFTADDFKLISFARENGLHLGGLMEPINEHWQPVFRALLAWEYFLFGNNPSGYYAVSILLHLANTFLFMILLSRLIPLTHAGLVGGALFGLSASYWRVPLWITTQGQILATLWFLLATLFFLQYLERRRATHLLLSSLLHLCMLSTFTMGIELPLLFFLFYVLFERERDGWARIVRGLAVTSPYFVAILIYLCARSLFVSGSPSVIGEPGDLSNLVAEIPTAVLFLAGGIYRGFLSSFTGVYLMPSASRWARLLYVGSSVTILLLLTDFTSEGIRKHCRMLFWLLCALLVMYFLPILPRLEWGLDWFAGRARYRYLPCLPAAALASIWFLHLRPLRRPEGRGALSFLATAVLGFVLLANAGEVRKREAFIHSQSHTFHAAVETFLAELHPLISKGMVHLVDESFSDGRTEYAGWNVKPSHLCRIYLPEEDVFRVRFLPEGKDQNGLQGEAYRVEKGTGHIVSDR